MHKEGWRERGREVGTKWFNGFRISSQNNHKLQ